MLVAKARELRDRWLERLDGAAGRELAADEREFTRISLDKTCIV
jgi:hypothetical protein